MPARESLGTSPRPELLTLYHFDGHRVWVHDRKPMVGRLADVLTEDVTGVEFVGLPHRPPDQPR